MAENEKNNHPEDEPEDSVLARRIRSLDSEEAQKEAPSEILCKPKTFRARLSNFWFHFKWPVILTACLVVAASVFAVQILSREDPDLYLMYAGPASLSSSGIGAIEESFEAFGEDTNGDGVRVASLLDLVVYTDEQMDKLQEEARDSGEELRFDTSVIWNARQRFSTEITAGDTIILLVDPNMYQTVYEAGGFLPLSEIFDVLPDGIQAVDDCGILLSSTDFGKYFSGVNELPEDTILCMRRLSIVNSMQNRKKAEALHAAHLAAFRRLVSYTSSTAADTGQQSVSARP